MPCRQIQQDLDTSLPAAIVMAGAARHHGDAEIVSRRVEGDIHRYTYRDLAARARVAGHALTSFQSNAEHELVERVQRTIVQEVQAYAKSQGYDLVIAQGVIYRSDAIDITAAVLTTLEKKAPAAATSKKRPSATGSKPTKAVTTPLWWKTWASAPSSKTSSSFEIERNCHDRIREADELRRN